MITVKSPPFMKGGDLINVLAAGVPNIIGEINCDFRINGRVGTDFATGVFLPTETGEGFVVNSGSVLNNTILIKFNANKNNAVYGASSTVQPSAISLISQIKF